MCVCDEVKGNEEENKTPSISLPSPSLVEFSFLSRVHFSLLFISFSHTHIETGRRTGAIARSLDARGNQ